MSSNKLSLDAVAGSVKRRSERSKAALAWRHRYNPATDPAFVRQPDIVKPVGIAPCSVELYEAVVAVNDVKRPSQFGQERDCWSPFRSERPARPAGQEVACRL